MVKERLDALELAGDQHDKFPVAAAAKPCGLVDDVQPVDVVKPEVLRQEPRLLRVPAPASRSEPRAVAGQAQRSDVVGLVPAQETGRRQALMPSLPKAHPAKVRRQLALQDRESGQPACIDVNDPLVGACRRRERVRGPPQRGRA